MKITVINGTEKHGVTYRLKETFLKQFPQAEVTEFYLPKDCPHFCIGCTTCILKDEKLCKAAEYTQKIEQAMLEADLLVFASPAYVYHITGAMKAMLDHLAYRWMPHRPAKEMFSKRAVIITQCLGGGEKSAAKDIKDSLSWWGVSSIRTCAFKLLSEVTWDKLPEKRRAAMNKKLIQTAKNVAAEDFDKRPHIKLAVKIKFFIVRMLQTSLGKKDPNYTDFKYWKTNGWIDKKRPWKNN